MRSVWSKSWEPSFLGLKRFPLSHCGDYRIPATLSPGMVGHAASCALTCSASLLSSFWFNFFVGRIPIGMFHISLVIPFCRLVPFFCILSFFLGPVVFFGFYSRLVLVFFSLKVIFLFLSPRPHPYPRGLLWGFARPSCSLNDSSALVQRWTASTNSESTSNFLCAHLLRASKGNHFSIIFRHATPDISPSMFSFSKVNRYCSISPSYLTFSISLRALYARWRMKSFSGILFFKFSHRSYPVRGNLYRNLW